MSAVAAVADEALDLTPKGRLYANLTKEYRAFASLAHTQRRLSWKARREAMACEADSDLPGYRKAAAEARRLWRDAIYHLERAQDRKDRRDAACC